MKGLIGLITAIIMLVVLWVWLQFQRLKAMLFGDGDDENDDSQ